MQKEKTDTKGNKVLLSAKEGAKEKGLRAETMATLKAVKGKNDSQKSSTGIIIGQAKDVYEAMRFLEDEDREKLYTLCLNAKNQVIHTELVSVGTLTESLMHPREVFKTAIKNSSASIICVHNHPSGDPTPSRGDIAITQKLEEAGKIIGIPMVDHVIIGKGSHISMTKTLAMNFNQTKKIEPINKSNSKSPDKSLQTRKPDSSPLIELISHLRAIYYSDQTDLRIEVFGTLEVSFLELLKRNDSLARLTGMGCL